jgi:polyhydroxyalkanoate depolymerase
MNLDRHVNAHMRQFDHLIRGDDDSADSHRRFYDEYLAVMDLTAEFYLQTIQVVFKEHQLPRGVWVSRGRPIEPAAIESALMTVEGELDDISGIGQTRAAPHADAEHSRRTACALGAAEGRSLRHLQRPQMARADHAARPRLHPRQRALLTPQSGACSAQPARKVIVTPVSSTQESP